MLRKLLALAVGSMLFFSANASRADVIVYDFEAEVATPPLSGSYTSLSMTSMGLTVTLTRTTGAAFDVILNVGGQSGKPASWMTKSLLADDPFTSLVLWNADFSAPITSAMMDFGDYGADDDSPVTMTAHSGLGGAGGTLDMDSDTWLASDAFPDFKTLSVASPGILSLRFASDGPFPNSLFWDNLTVVTPATAVPEPSSLVLLGLGAAGLWFRRRLAKKPSHGGLALTERTA